MEKDYRAAANRYLALAAEMADPEIASLFRALAEDCLAEVQRTSAQLQQQIQPKNSKFSPKSQILPVNRASRIKILGCCVRVDPTNKQRAP
jgi:hypothetical protein